MVLFIILCCLTCVQVLPVLPACSPPVLDAAWLKTLLDQQAKQNQENLAAILQQEREKNDEQMRILRMEIIEEVKSRRSTMANTANASASATPLKKDGPAGPLLAAAAHRLGKLR
jgi:hypothetical protein